MSSIAKSAQAFRTIAEASEELVVPAHVLRFWEGKFPQLRPLKRAGGRRHYRPDDMALLRGIRALLQEDGYQLKGVQKLLRDEGIGWVRERGNAGDGLDSAEDLPPILSATAAVVTPAALDRRATGPLFEERPTIRDIDTLSPAAGIVLRQALVKLERARGILERAASRPL
jgi:DNA-binding transcriptional MerR regulator